jgi:hypothetical protein
MNWTTENWKEAGFWLKDSTPPTCPEGLKKPFIEDWEPFIPNPFRANYYHTLGFTPEEAVKCEAIRNARKSFNP